MRKRKWLRRIGFAALGYLVLWATTWVFGPEAVNRHLAGEYFTVARDAQGTETAFEFRENVRFVGEGRDFGPDPMPERSPWACVRRPVVPAPFIVCADFAYMKDDRNGGAGRVDFVWTPWKLYLFGGAGYWVA